MPVPCTLSPFSILFCSLTSGCFGLSGINDSTLCSFASLKSSACRRREYAGPCQFPVRGFLKGRKGFRYAFASVSEWAISASEGEVVTVVVDAPALGSEEEVFSAIVIVEVSSDDGVVRVVVAAPAICGGGNFVKSLSSCPGKARASFTLTSFAAAIAIMVDMGVVRDVYVASGVGESSPQSFSLRHQSRVAQAPRRQRRAWPLDELLLQHTFIERHPPFRCIKRTASSAVRHESKTIRIHKAGTRQRTPIETSSDPAKHPTWPRHSPSVRLY